MRFAMAVFSMQRGTIQAKIARKVLEGKITPDQALAQIGMAMEGCIVDSIKSGNWLPNADSTVKKKGFNKPLIDKAVMFQTVSSKVT
ncbi:hypothetical protein PLUTO_00140 [Luteibacter phage vB_LflM-Pluto]|uniref:Uncharacterized protein n=1 Tax=Luteibacter phage vB_LflM-Pluto TaxID=2948611 RepID=A0A9E7SLR6_9CAUD|nr:hypothetical protein PLUTO_00140 [Luteibacter phage vB_LflM-Pluto]